MAVAFWESPRGQIICATAQAAAYKAVEKIQFEGAQFRRDIAAKALTDPD